MWGEGGVEHETERVIDLLVGAGGALDVVDEHGLGLMHGACMPYNRGTGFEPSDGFNAQAVRALLRHGLSIDVVFPDGRRPLHIVASEGNAEAVELLLSAGAAPDDFTRDGRTALELALDVLSVRCARNRVGHCVRNPHTILHSFRPDHLQMPLGTR